MKQDFLIRGSVWGANCIRLSFDVHVRVVIGLPWLACTRRALPNLLLVLLHKCVLQYVKITVSGVIYREKNNYNFVETFRLHQWKLENNLFILLKYLRPTSYCLAFLIFVSVTMVYSDKGKSLSGIWGRWSLANKQITVVHFIVTKSVSLVGI